LSAPTATMVALTPPAQALLGQVTADPSAPICAGVCAAGGYGKTTLLRQIEAAYRAAGCRVRTTWQSRSAGPPDEVVLVDDVHLLDEGPLRELRELSRQPGARIVVAYRPWPRSAALAELTDALRRSGSPLVLPPLTGPEIGACLAALSQPPSPGLVGFVAAQTRGVPRCVARLASALAVDIGNGRTAPRVSPAASTPFAADLDELEPDLRTAFLAVEAGAGLSFELIGALLGRDSDAVAELMEAGRATGLLCPDGTLVPLARHAVAVLEPMAHRIAVRQRLAALQLERGGSVLSLVRPLLSVTAGGAPPGQPAGSGGTDGALGAGVSGARMGEAFEAAGAEALEHDPALAARLFAAAVAAGRPAVARRALATALAGDLHLASRLADQVVAGGDSAEAPDAAYVAAVALAHRGQLAASAELYRWAGRGPAAGFAVVGLVGTGQLAQAQGLAAEDRSTQSPGNGGTAGRGGPPTLLTAAAALMARGVCESLTGAPATALSALVQASGLLEPSGPTVLLPDSPAALGALLALHCGQLDTADVLLTRAIARQLGGPLLAARHHLLHAWLLMARGSTAAAQQRCSAVLGDQATPEGRPPTAATTPDSHPQNPGPVGLHGRDLLFAAALRAGLARRNSDLAALRVAWPDACQVLVGQPVDLFTLLPLGELAVAAARLGEQHRVAAHLSEADLLLRQLGEPALWSLPWHWNHLHAAIIAARPAEAERHAAALARHRGHSPYAAAIATAGQSWLAVLADRIDPDSVAAAARGLGALGLGWDGARLAGQAAIRTSDRSAMTALLGCARHLQGKPAERRNAAPGAPAAGRRRTGDPAGRQPMLSEREQQVAALVIAGLTYKQVADRLYLSAKTVEHHMARMRQRLGCTDRGDLLTQLRAMTLEPAAPLSPAATDGAP
jgi:DNA-binding CsgD family transcriptional regulator